MAYDWLSHYCKKQGIKNKKNNNSGQANNCTVEKTVRKKELSVKNFTSVERLLAGVMDDFKGFVSKEGELCRLKTLFDEGAGPDYEDINVQQLYLLRYVFAYAFENKTMYEWVLKDIGHHRNISVESIGCGCAVDSWALSQVMKKLGWEANEIKYRGVDLVSWKYRFSAFRNSFILKNAADYFEAKATLDSDIYIFPRSIGDFSDVDFSCILSTFYNKKIEKGTVYLLISQRKGSDAVSSKDVARTLKFMKVMEKRGYKKTAEKREDEEMNAGITKYDSLLRYPDESIEYLKELKNKCTGFSSKKNCKNDCDINKHPMLKASNLCFNCFKFERK